MPCCLHIQLQEIRICDISTLVCQKNILQINTKWCCQSSTWEKCVEIWLSLSTECIRDQSCPIFKDIDISSLGKIMSHWTWHHRIVNPNGFNFFIDMYPHESQQILSHNFPKDSSCPWFSPIHYNRRLVIFKEVLWYKK